MINEFKLLSIYTFSGVSSALFTYPLEILKTKKQVNVKQISNYFSGFQQSIYISILQQGLKFSLYNHLSQSIRNPFINGLTTGAIQGLLVSHFEIKKTLSQIYHYQSQHKKYLALFKNKSLLMTIICRDSLFSGCLFGISNSDFLDISDFKKKILAGTGASFLTSPIDVLKSKICVSTNLNISDLVYKSKPLIFFKGSLYRTIHMGSRYFIILSLNEKLVPYVKSYS